MFALEEAGTFAVVLGDVCGTGPAAAALTGLARHTIRDSAWHHDPPDQVLASLNRAVRRSGTATFVTCVYATIAPSDGGGRRLTIACGGHPLPILVDAQGATPLGRPGTLLGVVDDIDIHVTTVELGAGDVVVFHTDGATDVAPPHDLDDAAWQELVRDAARSGGSAEGVAENIQGALEAILPFKSRNDDIALLVLAVGEAGSQGHDQPGDQTEDQVEDTTKNS
jgi:phosphoserine phosphatase RsbU/P